MSAQLKAAYDDLVTYLGKDAKGKEKAKRLKDAANELRKKLAAAEEKLAQMEAVKDAARERADAAEDAKAFADRRRVVAEAETQQLANQLSQIAMKQLARDAYGAKENDKLAALVNHSADVLEVHETLQVLRRLRAHSPKCSPYVATMELHGQPLRVFARHQLGAGWSENAIWRLGASVALLTASYGVIMIGTGKTPAVRVSDFLTHGSESGIPANIILSTELVQWTADHRATNEDHYAMLDDYVTSIPTKGAN